MKKVIISCGPIPARLDSVKYLTNRFKGGLAFKTAESLVNAGFQVTVVKWDMTEYVPPCDGVEVVNVKDVFDYVSFYEKHAHDYDAFIMAAAVANLTPSNPYEGKFPSHKYQVGERFNIEFEIAPRAIDVIKRLNPRACLIGYKLIDAQSDEELIETARHTLHNSKANVIFANTPSTAKSRKIAVMQDNANIEMTFDEHLQFMIDVINAEYFRTDVIPLTKTEAESTAVRNAFAIVEMFEKTFDGFGTVAVHVSGGSCIATTSRGHKGGAVLIRDVDLSSKVVTASGKATLNAPALWTMLSGTDNDVYVVHRHLNRGGTSINYLLPGTVEEAEMLKKVRVKMEAYNAGTLPHIHICHHGDIQLFRMQQVDWAEYYETFPQRYFSTPPEMLEYLSQYSGMETLEVGGNNRVACKYSYDPFVASDTAINLNWAQVLERQFDFVMARNSINYLSINQIKRLLEHTRGVFIANTFLVPPAAKVTVEEAAIRDEFGNILHFLRQPGDQIICHNFFAYTQDVYESLGFKVQPYGRNSALLIFER